MMLEAFSWQLEQTQPTHQAGWKCWQVSTQGTDLMDKYSNFLARERDNKGRLYAVSQRPRQGWTSAAHSWNCSFTSPLLVPFPFLPPVPTLIQVLPEVVSRISYLNSNLCFRFRFWRNPT